MTCPVREKGNEIISQIEKFLQEPNPPKGTAMGRQGKSFRTTADLEQVLNAEGEEAARHKYAKELASKKEQLAKTMKRVGPESSSSTDAKRKRGRPKQSKATVSSIPYYECKRLRTPKPEKARIVRTAHHRKAKITTPVIQYARTYRAIKSEIDLTDDSEEYRSFTVVLHFAKEKYEFLQWEQVQWCLFPHFAHATVSQERRCEATVSSPQVCFHMDNTCIDLTDDNDIVIVASEKECANRILSIVYRFHLVAYEENTLPLSLELSNALSVLYVKNLDLHRFLNILRTKLEFTWKVHLEPRILALYLHSMLGHSCNGSSELIRNLFGQLKEYMENLSIKEEVRRSTEEGYFTAEQIRRLVEQIYAYFQVASRQRELLLAEEEQSVSSMTKEVKMDLLEAKEEIDSVGTVIDLVIVD